MNHKKIYPSYFLIIPLVLYVGLFIIPSFMGMVLSLTDWNAMNDEIHFVGLSHFIDIFTDERYIIVIVNTVIFAIVTTIFKNVIGFSMALALKALRNPEKRDPMYDAGLSLQGHVMAFAAEESRVNGGRVIEL